MPPATNFHRALIRASVRRQTVTAWGVVLVVIALGSSSQHLCGAASAAAPEVTQLIPPGGQRGSKVIVKCEGNFAWPVQVEAKGVDVAVTPESGKLEVSIPADLAADRAWIRVYNSEGTSLPLPFLIGSLPELEEVEPNDVLRNAQTLPQSQITINGRFENGVVDCYRVELTKGDTLVVAMQANHLLGAPLDGVLQVVSADGFVLAENHDDVRLDPLVAYAVPRTGVYFVRAAAFPAAPRADVNFAGRANYLYRLTITNGPFLLTTRPTTVSNVGPQRVQAVGWNLAEDLRIPVLPLGHTTARSSEFAEQEGSSGLRIPAGARLGIVHADGMAGSARVRMLPENVAIQMPTNDGSAPTELKLPAALTGWLKTANQQGIYKCTLTKGQPLVVVVESSRIDSLLDPAVTLTGPSGAVIPEPWVSGQPQKDALLTYVAPADGDYILTIRDPYHMDTLRRCYRLSAWIEEPDFELALASDSILVSAEKPTELAIQVTRRTGMDPSGNVGPITIEAVGLPAGVTAEPVVSESSGGTAAAVKLQISSTGPNSSGPIQVVGRSTAPRPIERWARTPERLGACFESLWLTVTK